MTLPTAREINPFKTLDGNCAERNFLDKDLDEAQLLFQSAYGLHQEDLMFMGPIGFRYYVQAAIRYIKGPAAKDDCCVAIFTAGYLDHHLKYESTELIPIADQLADLCQFIVDHWADFDDEYHYFLAHWQDFGVEYHSEERDVYQRLQSEFAALSELQKL